MKYLVILTRSRFLPPASQQILFNLFLEDPHTLARGILGADEAMRPVSVLEYASI